MFGERLRLARRRSGLSLRALSSRIEGIVSAQAIGKYERGEMMPSSGVAVAMAETLGVHLGYLMSPSRVSLESVEFSKPVPAGARERAAVEAQVLDHVDRYLQIEEILGISTGAWDEANGDPHPIAAVEDAELAAASVRTAWNLGERPVADMTALAEERGVRVIRLDLPGSADGLSCRVRGNGGGVPVFACSTGTSLERQRLTIARELGHLMLDIAPTVRQEKACHRFAGAFLAPGDELRCQVGQRRRSFGLAEIIEIKHMFGIGAAALMVRMRDVGIIGEATLREIFRGIGRNWRKSEPCPLEREEAPRRFTRLCLRALAEREISASKASELLRLRVSQIEVMLGGVAPEG